MKVALDTNVLAYAAGVNGVEKQALALQVIQDVPPSSVILPVQVLGELYNVLTRKAGRTPTLARDTLMFWQDTYSVVATSLDVMNAATYLSIDHQVTIWDAVILAVASETGCSLLLSEDMQSGFRWGGVTIVDPFASPRHPRLESLLSGDTPR